MPDKVITMCRFALKMTQKVNLEIVTVTITRSMTLILMSFERPALQAATKLAHVYIFKCKSKVMVKFTMDQKKSIQKG